MKNYTQLLVFLLIFIFSGATYSQTHSWSFIGEHTWLEGRWGHDMAYIGDDNILMFGGVYSGGQLYDTSVYDLSSEQWLQLSWLTTKPSARDGHKMAYIGDDKVLLFGGNRHETAQGDTWLFDLSDESWTLLTPASSPSARAYHEMVYMGDDKVLLYGGGNFNNETWIFDLSDGTWVQMYPATSPPLGRVYHSMAKIGDQKAVMFGGVDYLTAGDRLHVNQETWVYDLINNTWTLMNPGGTPLGRYFHDMAFLGGDKVILYGGLYWDYIGGDIYNPELLDDTWIYDLSDNTWSEHSQSSFVTPPAMWRHALTEISVDGGDIVLFGGAENYGQTELSKETWVFERLVVYFPDANFEQALIDLGIDSDGTINQSVATSDISGITTLDVSSKGIADLTGIEDFSSLQELYCTDNDLSRLDISKNTALTWIRCDSNQLTSLDLSNNTAITGLGCNINPLTSLDLSNNVALNTLGCDLTQIESLDLSKNIELTTLFCSANPITGLDLSQNPKLEYLRCVQNDLMKYLNVKNGNNQILTYLAATENPLLTCIQVDDASAAIAGSGVYADWLKDAIAGYSEDCQAENLTYVPDDNFEQALIDLGYDDVLDDYVVTSNISGITSLNVEDKEISDLTGIRDFSSLTSLICRRNQLTSIDLSQNINLRNFYCEVNQLTSLDVSQNSELRIIACWSNNLTSLDVSQNIVLNDLHCYDNQLTSLNVSQNTALEKLGCGDNQLTSLDISQNTALVELYLGDCQLTNLDVSQNLALETFVCYRNYLATLDVSLNSALISFRCFSNQLTSLNVKNGNNSILTSFNAIDNPNLTCLQVDNETEANAGTGVYASWEKDETTNYSEDCGAVSIDDERLAKGLNLYPNPVTNILTIDSETPLTKVEIYSILGKKVKEINSDLNSIPTNNLSNGVYYIRIHSEKGITTKKMIKN